MTCDVIHVVGARPNFMKMAPVYKALSKKKVNQIVVHSGQHYDRKMSDCFFEDLKIPDPEINLNINDSSSCVAIGRMIINFENIFLKENPKIVIVYGDINTTLAATLSAKKLSICTAHVESGLRSFDMNMPEEQNRKIVDNLSDILFVTEKSGLVNLKNENIKNQTYFVGNTMIDSLIDATSNLKKKGEEYGLLTFHRPSNVDSGQSLKKIISLCQKIDFNKIIPLHPRTKNSLIKNELLEEFMKIPKMIVTDPMSYLSFVDKMNSASFVLTDSGGIQEEAAFLKVPCITYRTSTERPSTIDCGSNTLTQDHELIISTIEALKMGNKKEITTPDLWDGNSGSRIAEILVNYF